MNKKELDNQINQVLLGWEIPSKQSKSAIWQAITKKTTSNNKNLFLRSNLRWVAAASFIGAILSIGLFYNAQVTISSSNHQASITLPDGSLLALNADSKASFNSITWIFNRSVILSGEGFFNVIKGSQFTVNTDHGSIKVLGTSFNVIARPNKFEVECFTGKVRVYNGYQTTSIIKGEHISQTSNLTFIKEEKNQSSSFPRWLAENYLYKKEQLKVVFDDISSHFGIEINANTRIKKSSFTGQWNKTMTLEEVLKIVCLPFNLEANSISENEIQIVEFTK